MPAQDPKFSSPAALRNREPILEILRNVLPKKGTILEIASGSGEHVTHYAALLPDLVWQPSDPSLEARASIASRMEEDKLLNLLPPLDIDVSTDIWPIDKADAMLAINMVHISPWAATEGLLKGAGRLLSIGGVLVLYGPYRQKGHIFVESNVAFDASLKSRNPEWGIRQLEAVAEEAAKSGLALTSVTNMPANNLCVVFTRT